MANMNQIASAAYGATQRLPVMRSAEDKTAAEGGSFADLVQQGLDKFISTQQQSEKLSSDAVIGKADMSDVIMAVQNADVVLTAVTAVRDKVVSAYQDILRMAI